MYTLENPETGKKHTTTIEIGLKVQKLLEIVESNGDKLELIELYLEISDVDQKAIDLFFPKANSRNSKAKKNSLTLNNKLKKTKQCSH